MSIEHPLSPLLYMYPLSPSMRQLHCGNSVVATPLRTKARQFLIVRLVFACHCEERSDVAISNGHALSQ